LSASGAFGYPTRGLIGDDGQVAVIGAGIVIGARRDPSIADIRRLRGNGDKRGVSRRGTRCEQPKYDEEGEAGKYRAVSELPEVSVNYRAIELWLAKQIADGPGTRGNTRQISATFRFRRTVSLQCGTLILRLISVRQRRLAQFAERRADPIDPLYLPMRKLLAYRCWECQKTFVRVQSFRLRTADLTAVCHRSRKL
jgi:hypothetical protein